MRYAAALAAIPVPILMWGAWPKAAPPMVPTAVMTEGITMRRMSDSFAMRFAIVPTISLTSEKWSAQEGGDAQVRESTSKPVETPARSSPPARLVRRAALRSPMDVCARHGLRRVSYSVRGYQHWRCRR